MLDAAYTAWLADQAAGHAALLVAADTRTVTALNQRAHLDRLTTGDVTGPTRPLAGTDCTTDRGSVGVGDRIITRRNDRTLRSPDGQHVRNGDLWTVTALHPDGSLDATPASGERRSTARGSVRLPAGYVAEHVDLGYAITVHRAQGATVDRAHVLTSPSMGREALYVAMTRGRDANTVYVATDHPDPDCDHPDLARPDDGPRDVLTRILQTPTGEHSATETRQTAAEDAASLRRLVPIRATIAAALDRRRWPRLLEQAGLTREQTEQIHQSPAAGALYAELRHAEHLGHRAATVTAALARQAPLDDADDLAAVLHHRLGTWLATAPDLTDAGETPAVERLGLTDRGSTGQSALDDDLAHVDALIHHRADEVTTRLSATPPEWLPPGRASEPLDRHHLAIVAAHADLAPEGPAGSSRTDQARARLARAAAAHLTPDPSRSIA